MNLTLSASFEVLSSGVVIRGLMYVIDPNVVIKIQVICYRPS